MKRFFDLFLSCLIIIFFSPFICLVFLFILITMGLPVIFKQIRPGLRGKPFIIYKFRTMRNLKNSEGVSLPDSLRLTSTGRFLRKISLDELPQLFNIIKGDLSFVGPRPLLMEYLPLYTPEQARRHEVKPGITGWAQVNGRNAITWEEKFDLDIWYVDHRNLFLDMKILWLTLIKVLKKEGINADGCATMPEFTGSHMNGE